MKNLAKVSIITSLIFSIISCSVFSIQANQPAEIATTDEKPIIVLATGYANYPRIALFNGGEVLVPLAEINAEGQVTNVSGVVFIAPDGRSITLYFENGLPVRAIAEDHLIQFENFTGSAVDITVIAPDGAINKKEQVPFDINQVSPMGSRTSIYLASMAKKPSYKDINWLSFASTALGVFSCAATVATGGALSVLLGVSCGILIYTTYLAIVEKDPPVQIESAGLVVSSTNCALGIIQKEPLAASECVTTVIDVIQIATKKSQETEQKLVTMAGANPDTRSELVIEATVEPVPMPAPASECAGLNLTPEECANYGMHEYKLVSCNSEQSGTCLSQTNLCDYIEQTKKSYFAFSNMEWVNAGLNTYSTEYNETRNNVPYGYGTYNEVIHSTNTTIFTADGFTEISKTRQARTGADNWDCSRTMTSEYVITK